MGDSGLKTFYLGGCVVFGLILFLGAWIYCIAAYGFLIGVILGWIAASIFALVLCWFWPLVAIAAIWIFLKTHS
jgi:hypothetical protein